MLLQYSNRLCQYSWEYFDCYPSIALWRNSAEKYTNVEIILIVFITWSYIVILCEYSYRDYFSHTMVRHKHQQQLRYEPATVIYVSVLGFLLSLFGSVGTRMTVPTVYLLFSSASFTPLSYFDLYCTHFACHLLLMVLYTCSVSETPCDF